jgi:hypothetical protein
LPNNITQHSSLVPVGATPLFKRQFCLLILIVSITTVVNLIHQSPQIKNFPKYHKLCKFTKITYLKRKMDIASKKGSIVILLVAVYAIVLACSNPYGGGSAGIPFQLPDPSVFNSTSIEGKTNQ